ncbi:hypothetical protein B0H13DRAFT_2172969, partial [Mycena leptocephala]
DSQFIAILYALNTFYMVYMLIPHTVQKDNDAVSRLNKQFVIINFLLLCCAGITRTLHSCAAITFMSPKCLTIGWTWRCLGTISWNIYQDARAIQAVQAVPRQQQPHAPFKLRPARVRRGASSASVA